MSEAMTGIVDRLDPGQRARSGRLTLETLRWADRADRMLGPYLRLRPAEPVLNLLRLGATEMCQLGEAPHGVVNDLVGLAAEAGGKSVAGLANAVLRRIARAAGGWAELPPPRLQKWLRKRLVAVYGKATVEAMETAHSNGAQIDLTARALGEGGWADRLDATVLPSGSLRLRDGGELTRLPGYRDGAWWVQDAAAALPARLLDPRPGERILDLCAAPGGKTLQLVAAGAAVTALDISDRRASRISENLARTGLTAEIVIADALRYEAPPFDAILLDAPCTATGTIRRHPDLPYAKDGSEIAGLVELQARLIDRALELLKPGGRMVFCTCSLLPEEGEAQISAALARHPDLRLGTSQLPGIPSDWSGETGLRTRPDYWPEMGGLDGFFISLMHKLGKS